MTSWTGDELAIIDSVDELRIAARRRNGTLSRSTPVWVVRTGDDLYVRSYRGVDATWYRAVSRTAVARVSAAGVVKDVALAREIDPAVNNQVDAAFRTKYGRYGRSFVEPMTADTARAATLKLIPGGMPPADR